jgi:hypothetical protein
MKVVRRHQGFHRREGNKQEKETAVENELWAFGGQVLC